MGQIEIVCRLDEIVIVYSERLNGLWKKMCRKKPHKSMQVWRHSQPKFASFGWLSWTQFIHEWVSCTCTDSIAKTNIYSINLKICKNPSYTIDTWRENLCVYRIRVKSNEMNVIVCVCVFFLLHGIWTTIFLFSVMFCAHSLLYLIHKFVYVQISPCDTATTSFEYWYM